MPGYHSLPWTHWERQTALVRQRGRLIRGAMALLQPGPRPAKDRARETRGTIARVDRGSAVPAVVIAGLTDRRLESLHPAISLFCGRNDGKWSAARRTELGPKNGGGLIWPKLVYGLVFLLSTMESRRSPACFLFSFGWAIGRVIRIYLPCRYSLHVTCP